MEELHLELLLELLLEVFLEVLLELLEVQLLREVQLLAIVLDVQMVLEVHLRVVQQLEVVSLPGGRGRCLPQLVPLQLLGCWRFTGDDSGCTGRVGVLAEEFSKHRCATSRSRTRGMMTSRSRNEQGGPRRRGEKSFVQRLGRGYSRPSHEGQERAQS